jgi:hypothetical protein
MSSLQVELNIKINIMYVNLKIKEKRRKINKFLENNKKIHLQLMI